MTVYVQVYLFIILYSYWIVTNIIQYLLYLVVLMYEYLSVQCIHSTISEQMGSAMVSKNYATFLWKYKDLSWWRGVLPYLGMVERFQGDYPHFCDCRSDWVPIVWCNQILLTPSFCRKHQLVSITFSSRDTWT